MIDGRYLTITLLNIHNCRVCIITWKLPIVSWEMPSGINWDLFSSSLFALQFLSSLEVCSTLRMDGEGEANTELHIRSPSWNPVVSSLHLASSLLVLSSVPTLEQAMFSPKTVAFWHCWSPWILIGLPVISAWLLLLPWTAWAKAVAIIPKEQRFDRLRSHLVSLNFTNSPTRGKLISKFGNFQTVVIYVHIMFLVCMFSYPISSFFLGWNPVVFGTFSGPWTS